MFRFLTDASVLALAVTIFSPSLVTSNPILSGITVPDCQAVAPPQTILRNVRTAQLNFTNGSPFGLAYAKHGKAAFVALEQSIGVLNTSHFPPTFIRNVSIPTSYLGPDGVLGVSLNNKGDYLFAAAGSGAVVLDTEKAIAGSTDSVVGQFTGSVGTSAIEVTISSDDKYAFVSQEYGSTVTKNHGAVEVFRIQPPTANGSVVGKYVGYVALGSAVVGTALSPCGRFLYATSEIASNGTRQGTLSVLDVAGLKKNSSHVIINSVDAGCSPVRIVVSPEGKVIWVTVRESNRLVAFDAFKLHSNATKPLIASVQVGTSPVGITFAKNASRILTADSNRFNYQNTTTGLTVVDTHAALAGKPAVLGSIPTGKFPREFSLSPDGTTLLVADFQSRQVQAIKVASIP